MDNQFNLEKTIHATLYIVKKLKRADLHKIFKILYFSDREMLSSYGKMITGDTYIAMNDGPVPSKLYDILKSVRGDGFFKDKDFFSTYFAIRDWDIVTAKIEPDMESLSRLDIQTINSAIQQYGELSWDEVREKSHDYAWRNTTSNHPISLRNIMLEMGCNDSFINYVLAESAFSQKLAEHLA